MPQSAELSIVQLIRTLTDPTSGVVNAGIINPYDPELDPHSPIRFNPTIEIFAGTMPSFLGLPPTPGALNMTGQYLVVRLPFLSERRTASRQYQAKELYRPLYQKWAKDDAIAPVVFICTNRLADRFTRETIEPVVDPSHPVISNLGLDRLMQPTLTLRPHPIDLTYILRLYPYAEYASWVYSRCAELTEWAYSLNRADQVRELQAAILHIIPLRFWDADHRLDPSRLPTLDQLLELTS